MENFFQGKRVLITGVAGSVGKELLCQLLQLDVKEVKGLDNCESSLFYLNEKYRLDQRFNGFYCDIRDVDRLKYLFKSVDVVFHCAALKHITISEVSPFDAVKTNAEGTLNVVSASLESDSVDRVVYTSSDKAVNSTNVMGTTKLLGERIMTSAANFNHPRKIIFTSTRFGNVIGSSGSVVPSFVKQIKESSSVFITHEDMTRFFMTINEAAKLVLEASMLAKGGEVFVTKMPVMKIIDLATVMIDMLAPMFGKSSNMIEKKFIGIRPGEKMYEELMTDEEAARAYELTNMYVIRPSLPYLYDTIDYRDYESLVADYVQGSYCSAQEKCMTLKEIKHFLIEHEVLQVGDFNLKDELKQYNLSQSKLEKDKLVSV